MLSFAHSLTFFVVSKLESFSMRKGVGKGGGEASRQGTSSNYVDNGSVLCEGSNNASAGALPSLSNEERSSDFIPKSPVPSIGGSTINGQAVAVADDSSAGAFGFIVTVS